MTAPSQCPVCQARFRGARVCSRCGADLGPLMLHAAKAWRLRQQARQSIESGDTDAAFRLASQAQELRWTRHGESLRLLSAWCKALRMRTGILPSIQEPGETACPTSWRQQD